MGGVTAVLCVADNEVDRRTVDEVVDVDKKCAGVTGGSRISKRGGGAENSRAPHTGGVRGPAVGPMAKCRARAPAGAQGAGAQGAEPPEALEFSASKGLQNGRQE